MDSERVAVAHNHMESGIALGARKRKSQAD
jgi:hypothetical protein